MELLKLLFCEKGIIDFIVNLRHSPSTKPMIKQVPKWVGDIYPFCKNMVFTVL